MKIALLGATGMLGSKMKKVLEDRGHQVLAPPRAEADLGQRWTLEKLFESPFDGLVNCAAHAGVDACEDPMEYHKALVVNGTGPGLLASLCNKAGRWLAHYSTDYVFDGRKEAPYLERDNVNPVNAYGKSKLAGEKEIQAKKARCYLIRTSWLFGPGGPNFVKTITGLLGTKERIEVVGDQMGGPTYTKDLALFTAELLERGAEPGLYHFANAGHVSWFGFAKEIQALTGKAGCEIAPTTSDKYVRPAKRPANSRFDLGKSTAAVGHPPRPWQTALREYLTEDYDG